MAVGAGSEPVAVGPGPASTGMPSPSPVLTSSPMVRFGDDRRPEAATHVSLEAFDGPLALLLSLIEGRQLDVLTVPLGALAEAYLDALSALDAGRLANVSAFIAVAGQLILIKSRAMLPGRVEDAAALMDEAPDPEAELRARLLLYRAYRDAGAGLAAIAASRGGIYHREPSIAQAAGRTGAVAEPLPPLDVALLPASLVELLKVSPPPPPPPEIMGRTLTIAARADVIRAALRSADTVVLQEILRGVRDRVVIAVTFLAMLELVKRREIVIGQAEPWGPISVRATTAEERITMRGPNRVALPVGGTSIESEPIDESLESFA